MKQVVGEAAKMVRWKHIQEVLAEAANLTDKKVQNAVLAL